MRWFAVTAVLMMVGCVEEVFPFVPVDGDADVDGDGDVDGDADADVDVDVDADADEQLPVTTCPGDESMILIRVDDVFTAFESAPWGFPDHDYCIDRYEASRGPAGAAASVAGVLPWVEATHGDALGACLAAGKRLCTPREWLAACHGPKGSTYPYGDGFVQDACNGRDMETDTDGVLATTGSHEQCQGGFGGLYDLSGNAHELTWDSGVSNYVFAGSFFDGPSGLECENEFDQDIYSPGYETMGFRCCTDAPASACGEGFNAITRCVYSRCCDELTACNDHWGQCGNDTECMFTCVLEDPSGSVGGCTLFDCAIENPYAVALATCIDTYCTNDQL